MPTTPLTDIPVRSADELIDRWAVLLAPGVFPARSLWLAWFDNAGSMMPVVVPVDDVPPVPDGPLLDGLLGLHDAVVERTGAEGGHLALALCRPGTAETTEDDEAWADVLTDELADRLDGTWSFHVASAGTVRELLEPPLWTWPAVRATDG